MVRTRILVLLPLLWATSAFPIHLCTDHKGKKVYQDQPCASLPSTSKIVAVQATAVTEENARETLKRFDAAMMSRDSVAAMNMVSGYLEAGVLVEGKVVNVNTLTFKELIHRILIAVDKYEVQRDCQLTKDRDLPRDILLKCKVKESVKSNKSSNSSTHGETLRFAIEHGEVRIKKIQIDPT